ncbi:AcrR family transcriptional regulator [Sphingomonas sp. BE270]|jgi:TetR/AcrR family transcriptional repressor of mexJK operon|uniref:TetR/AcrR family transcriptional regulator n=1 Tax=Sphingomonas sp. BE270 TaxID=2817726 RepID=UPI0028603E2C|nr:helix-turn-helix domain-containing protein [Sphingomonas sp. BE270]MDR7256430.1 AcrR family transcriptional regulator [Sphingomonas sp. BE270]
MKRRSFKPNEGPLPPRDPKGGRPTQEIAVQLRAHILDVALEQFISLGADGASMERIAAAANVSKRTLYSRFGSKAQLLRTCVEHGVCRHLQPIATTIPKGSLRDRLLYAGEKMLDSSLKREVIGLETLILWLLDHEPSALANASTPGAPEGIRIIRSILESSDRTMAMEGEAQQFFARHVFDTLVTVPRNLILVRRDFPNTKSAKRDYLIRALDILLWQRESV